MEVIQVTSATTGTIVINDTGQDVHLIHDAGATLTMTVNFPATPVNGQILVIASAGGITTLTLSSSSTITGTLSSLVAGGSGKYQYLTTNNKWYKIN